MPTNERPQKPRGFRVPASWGERADLLLQLREERALAQRRVEEVEARARWLKRLFVEKLPKDLKASGVSGQAAKVTLVPKAVPTAGDWPKIYAYVRRTGDFSVLQRRLHEGAIRELWEQKKAVPGVTKFNYVDVSVGKR